MVRICNPPRAESFRADTAIARREGANSGFRVRPAEEARPGILQLRHRRHFRVPYVLSAWLVPWSALLLKSNQGIENGHKRETLSRCAETARNRIQVKEYGPGNILAVR